jgi:hypothetical protein
LIDADWKLILLIRLKEQYIAFHSTLHYNEVLLGGDLTTINLSAAFFAFALNLSIIAIEELMFGKIL